MVHVPLTFLSEGREFPSAPCLAGKKKSSMTARVSMLLKLRASPDMLPFSLCNKKRLVVRHMNRPLLSNDTVDSVLRHREVGRAKHLSAHPGIISHIFNIIFYLRVSLNRRTNERSQGPTEIIFMGSETLDRKILQIFILLKG